MAQARGNAALAAVIAQTGWSHAQTARAFVRVAVESASAELAGVGKSHITHWIGGSRPSGRAPLILCETLSRRLGRVVTLDEIGLGGDAGSSPTAADWGADTLVALADLGRVDTDMDRRSALGTAVYSMAALALPDNPWWVGMAQRGATRGAAAARTVGHGDLDAVRDMVALFSRVDQRRGGGHARTAVVQYLTCDVAGYLRGRFTDERIRRQMFSAASELAYLSGWMGFDNAEHPAAQRYFTVAVKLAAEADDPPMAGHVLRAMAHQAVDLGHPRQALELAAASMDGQRYTLASPATGPCSASCTPGRWPPPRTSRPPPRSTAPRTTSPPPRPAMTSRHGCSSSARPASPTKPPAPCVTSATCPALCGSSGAASAPAKPPRSPAPTR